MNIDNPVNKSGMADPLLPRVPELLAPAGSLDALDAAIGEGADAIYLGARSFNARQRSTNFAWNQLEAAVYACHKLKRKVYATVNVVFEERECDRIYQLLEFMNRIAVDAIIVQDFGVAQMAHECFPQLGLHASTQMNIASVSALHALSQRGFGRSVLARELSLSSITTIRNSTNVELEVFVHGALCVSVSGVCLFSSFLGGRSANRGQCTQACRRKYSSESKDGYFFSPHDLQLIGDIPALVNAGVNSFKIEGRMKSADYVSVVVRAYRYLLDHLAEGEDAIARAKEIVSWDFARSKTDFFFHSKLDENFIQSSQSGTNGIRVGKIELVQVEEDIRWAVLRCEVLPSSGDSVRLQRGGDRERWTAKIVDVRDGNPSMLRIDADFRQGDEIFLLQVASASRRYPRVLPNNLDRFRAKPSWNQAPFHSMEMSDVHEQEGMQKSAKPTRSLKNDSYEPKKYRPKKNSRNTADPDEALHIVVSRASDLFLIDTSCHPVVHFNRPNAEFLARHKAQLPIKKLGFWLDPWCDPEEEAWLSDNIGPWLDAGVSFFIANNLSHFGLLKQLGAHKKGEIVAGPWLYCFNSWAMSFLASAGARSIIPPFEGSRQNYKMLCESAPSSLLMPVVFAYPPLFRTKAGLAERYDFKEFSDRSDASFRLVEADPGSVVISTTAFSITERVGQFLAEGVRRIIVDFSYAPVNKGDCKDVLRAVRESSSLPGTSRFNWKTGFSNQDELRTDAPIAAAQDRQEAQETQSERPSRQRRSRGGFESREESMRRPTGYSSSGSRNAPRQSAERQPDSRGARSRQGSRDRRD